MTATSNATSPQAAGSAPASGGPVEWAVLEDVAAASRILVDQGVFDAAGHFSMRHPFHPSAS